MTSLLNRSSGPRYGPLKMKSSKPIIPLTDIIKPYTLIMPREIDMGLNKEQWHFKKGEEVALTYDQYEVLNHSEYGTELFGHNL
mgnify:CR=1 FL=1